MQTQANSPGEFRSCILLQLSEYLEQFGPLLQWYADPCVFDSAYELLGLLIIVQVHEDAALIGEFKGILKEVDENLTKALRVQYQHIRYWVTNIELNL